MTYEFLWGVGAAVVGAVVWLVRLEGRVNSHDRELADHKKHTSEDISQLREDVKYIRDRIDRALGTGR